MGLVPDHFVSISRPGNAYGSEGQISPVATLGTRLIQKAESSSEHHPPHFCIVCDLLHLHIGISLSWGRRVLTLDKITIKSFRCHLWSTYYVPGPE